MPSHQHVELLAMRTFRFLLLAIVMLCPLAGMAQDEEIVDFDSYLVQLNAECPINSGENWALMSFATSGDTVIVELEIPSSLIGFLSLLTDDNEKVKRMWIRELETFVNRLVDVGRPMILQFKPKGSEVAAQVAFSVADLKME